MLQDLVDDVGPENHVENPKRATAIGTDREVELIRALQETGPARGVGQEGERLGVGLGCAFGRRLWAANHQRSVAGRRSGDAVVADEILPGGGNLGDKPADERERGRRQAGLGRRHVG